MAKFSVLGAGGFIGRHLVRHLGCAGHEVSTFMRGDRVPLDGDLGHVVYCIGVTSDYAVNPIGAVEAHVCELLNLLRGANFKRLVYLSSVRLYDGVTGPASETSELRLMPSLPRHLYDLSKALGEALLHQAARGGVVARLAGVYDDELGGDDFLSNTVRAALRAASLDVESWPDTGRDYIHIDDVVRALELIALDARESTYNVASGTIFTNSELAIILKTECGCTLGFRADPTPRRPPMVDIRRLVRDFGLSPALPGNRLPTIIRSLTRTNAVT